jgi:phage gp29-like protein
LVRALAVPWLIRYWTRSWWARHQEVHGTPIRAGIIPQQRDPSDERLFLRQLANLAHEATIRLPQGTDGNKFDVKLIEAASNSWEGFQKLLDHCDDSIAILLVGQSQSTKGQGGLGTQENAGESTLLRLTRGDAKIYTILRTQVLKPHVAATDGDGNMAPYLCPQIEPPEDESERAKTDLIVGQALQAFKSAGAPIAPRAYLEKRGYGDVLMSEQEEAEMTTENEGTTPDEENAPAAPAEGDTTPVSDTEDEAGEPDDKGVEDEADDKPEEPKSE